MDKFLGHDIGFWIELKKRAEELNAVDLLDEVVNLQGKIAFYESRIRQMNEVMNTK